MDSFDGVIIVLTYVLLCKIWPYFMYPNYFKRSRIESYAELKKLSLNLKNEDRLRTIENVYRYMQEIYTGHNAVWKTKSLLSVFKLGDFPTDEILYKQQFLWCHNQNRIFKSILVNTGLFADEEIHIEKRLFTSFFYPSMDMC